MAHLTSKELSDSALYSAVNVMRKVQIHAILGYFCANLGFVLLAIILVFCVPPKMVQIRTLRIKLYKGSPVELLYREWLTSKGSLSSLCLLTATAAS